MFSDHASGNDESFNDDAINPDDVDAAFADAEALDELMGKTVVSRKQRVTQADVERLLNEVDLPDNEFRHD